VPPKLSAQVRVFATGNGRKTDPVDAHSVAMAAFHNHGLLHVEVDDDLLVLGMLADRRDELGRARTQTVNRLHRLLLELLAGGPKKDLSAKQARELIVTVKPRDLPGKTRRRLAVELIGERESIDRKIKTGDKEIEALVLERDSTLMDLFGIAAASAVRLLVDVGDIHRFANRDRFASWNGTVSSGNQERHRLSRVGNRRINRTIHIMAINQLRHRTEGRAFYDRHRAGGMPSMMALRVLKRRLSNVIFARMLADQTRREARVATGPGGHSGNDSVSSAVDSHPGIDSSKSHIPDPPAPSLEPDSQLRLDGMKERGLRSSWTPE